MKRLEISKGCAVCGKGIMHDGQIAFYRVAIDHFVSNLQAIQRTHGLEQFFGGGPAGAALADAMGTDEDLAIKVSSNNFLVCQKCMIGHASMLLTVVENINDQEDEENEKG